jgi:hypothetical protein
VVSASVSVAEGISESSSAFVSASRVSQLPDLAVILAVKDEINDFRLPVLTWVGAAQFLGGRLVVAILC